MILELGLRGYIKVSEAEETVRHSGTGSDGSACQLMGIMNSLTWGRKATRVEERNGGNVVSPVGS